MKKKIVAQFGGVGGQGNSSSYSPGSSPLGKGGMGGGKSIHVSDDGLDAIMGRTRTENVEYDASIETMLQPFHSFVEEDLIPYELDRKEREKLNVKKQLQRRRKFYEDSIRSIDENDPKYINDHFFPKPEHLLPLDELLGKCRINDENRETADKDQVVIVDKEVNERAAGSRYSTQKVYSPTSTVFDSYQDDEEETDPMGGEEAKMHKTPADGYITHTPTMFTQKEFDDNLGKEGQDFLDFTEEQTLAFDHPGQDEVSYDGEANIDTPPSPITQFIGDTNMTTENKLRNLTNQQTPGRLPNDPYQEFNLDKTRNQGKEPQGLADKYEDVGNGSPALPHM